MTIFPEFEKQLVELAATASGTVRRPQRRWRVPSAAVFMTAFAATTAIAIAVVAIALLGHARVGDHGRAASRPRPVAPGRVPTLAQLEANFAVLRHPQTPADRLMQPPCGHPCSERMLPSLTRLARQLPNGDRVVLSVWRLGAPDLGQLAGSYSLHVDVLGPSAAEIIAADATSSATNFGANVDYTVMPFATPDTETGPVWTGLVPDGVSSVQWTFTCPSGRARDRCSERHSLAPVSTQVEVIGNVAAAQVLGTGDAHLHTTSLRVPTQADWYTGRGYQVASFRSTKKLSRPPFLTPKLPAARAIAPAVASQLSVFARARTSADALPASFSALLHNEHASAGLDVADSRRVKASDGQTAYLVPASGGACVINTNEALCSQLASLPGAAAVDLCSPTLPAGQLEIEWLLPDGATKVALGGADGTATRFGPGFNVYIARLPIKRPLPKTIEWDDAGGQHHSVSAGIPSDAQSQSCMHPSDLPAPAKASHRPSATTATAAGQTATVVGP